MRVRIQRDGFEIGKYSSRRIPRLLAKGVLLPTDSCVLDAGWVKLSDHPDLKGFLSGWEAARKTAPKSAEGDAPVFGDPLSWLVVPSVILSVVLIAAVVGAGFWLSMLMSESGRLRAENEVLSKAAEEMRLKIERIEAELNIYKPPGDGAVAGRVAYSRGGKVYGLSGRQVSLYRREDVDSAFEAAKSQLVANGIDPLEGSADLGEFYFRKLPAPFESALTDSSGFFRMKIPQPGKYVLVSRSVDQVSNELILWMIGFDDVRAKKQPIIMDASNRIVIYRPDMMVLSIE